MSPSKDIKLTILSLMITIPVIFIILRMIPVPLPYIEGGDNTYFLIYRYMPVLFKCCVAILFLCLFLLIVFGKDDFKYIKFLTMFGNLCSIIGLIFYLVWHDAENNNFSFSKLMESKIGIAGCLAVFSYFLVSRWRDKSQVEEKSNIPEEISLITIPEDIFQIKFDELKIKLIQQYEYRLNNKVTFHLPINMSGKPTTFGTSNRYTNDYQLNKDLTFEYDNIQKETGKILKSHGRLLLIGEGGAGKTTVLLSAALNILKDSEEELLPLIINLATWQKDFNFQKWYARIISESYDISLDFTNNIIEKDSTIKNKKGIIPFFDGFDEIKGENRTDLFEKMQDYFSSNKNMQFVISSRKTEYYDSNTPAPVYAQFEVKPLTIKQIRSGLKNNSKIYGSDYALLNEVNKNSNLREIIKTPFYLNTLSFLYNKNINLTIEADNVASLKVEIVKKFIEKQVPNLKDRKHLSYLAKKMKDDGFIIFEMAKIQPSWCRFPALHAAIYGIILGILAGYFKNEANSSWYFNSEDIHKIYIKQFLDLLSGIVLGLIIAPILGLIGIFSLKEIKTFDIQSWRVDTFKRNIKRCWGIFFLNNLFLNSLAGGYICMFVGIFSGISKDYAALFNIGLYFGLFRTLRNTGLSTDLLFHLQHKYDRFTSSLKFSLWEIPIFIIAIFFGINMKIFKLESYHVVGNSLDLTLKNLYILMHLFPIYFLGIKNSNLIRHLVVYFILKIEGKLSFRFAKFLDRTTKLFILESNSKDSINASTWRFRHKILQDYFADMKFEK